MLQKNSDKEPANQQSVHSVIEQFNGQQGTSEVERPNVSYYEPITCKYTKCS